MLKCYNWSNLKHKEVCTIYGDLRMLKVKIIRKLEDKPRSTSVNGLPLAKIILSPTMENASSGVHSAAMDEYKNTYKYSYVYVRLVYVISSVPLVVGFDIANIAGLVEVDPLSASNTYGAV